MSKKYYTYKKYNTINQKFKFLKIGINNIDSKQKIYCDFFTFYYKKHDNFSYSFVSKGSFIFLLA
ncbi:hypothetical protein CSB08_00600 [Candidatus Gracilibacteria bacterium]|nr:MAG: hypothetical protein CSB08_00600 [Candidatus Gracilibacteria bacterium]PIE84875.1 MAG: hypothetical protein CSA08_04935 [Candidatus Gracilibacteria bacterium]